VTEILEIIFLSFLSFLDKLLYLTKNELTNLFNHALKPEFPYFKRIYIDPLDRNVR